MSCYREQTMFMFKVSQDGKSKLESGILLSFTRIKRLFIPKRPLSAPCKPQKSYGFLGISYCENILP